MRRWITGLLATTAALGMSLPASALITGAAPVTAPRPKAESGLSAGESLTVSGSGDEMILGDVYLSETGDRFAEARGQAAGGTRHLQTVPADGVQRISVSVSRCALLVEPSDTGSFELELGGVQGGAVTASAVSAGGVLSVKASGTSAVRYASAAPDAPANAAVLRVPAERFYELKFAVDTAVVHSFAAADSFTGEIGRGGVRIAGDEIGRCELSATNGSIRLEADTFTGKLALKSENGSIAVAGETVKGEVYAASKNGAIDLRAGTLGQATVTAGNGPLLLDIGTLAKNVYLNSRNGPVRVNFRRFPEDLDFVFSGSNFDEMKLPRGWEGGTVIGGGEPRLTLRTENGPVNVSVGKFETE